LNEDPQYDGEKTNETEEIDKKKEHPEYSDQRHHDKKDSRLLTLSREEQKLTFEQRAEDERMYSPYSELPGTEKRQTADGTESNF